MRIRPFTFEHVPVTFMESDSETESIDTTEGERERDSSGLTAAGSASEPQSQINVETINENIAE